MGEKQLHSEENSAFCGRDTQTKRCLCIQVAGNKIVSIRQIPDDPSLPWISAGWIDLQVNGCFGYDFNKDAVTPAEILHAVSKLHSCGVTQFLPTIITGSFERMSQAMRAVDQACNSDSLAASTIPGIHMEGPWISSKDGPRGAHDLRYVKDGSFPEYQALQHAAGGRIIKITLAPERENAVHLIEQLVIEGIHVAIGHSNATRSQIQAAVDAGASLSTHLGNGSHPLLPRHHNYIWEQLAETRLYAGLIADGHHLPPAVLLSFLRCKAEKAYVVSDCVSLAGLPPGEYSDEIGSSVILDKNGRLYTKENPNILAGSSATLIENVEYLTGQLNLPLAEAICLVTERPAAAMKWTDMGQIQVGKQANLTLFDFDADSGKISIRQTVVKGMSVYCRN